jgi:hypothetical protein
VTSTSWPMDQQILLNQTAGEVIQDIMSLHELEEHSGLVAHLKNDGSLCDSQTRPADAVVETLGDKDSNARSSK